MLIVARIGVKGCRGTFTCFANMMLSKKGNLQHFKKQFTHVWVCLCSFMSMFLCVCGCMPYITSDAMQSSEMPSRSFETGSLIELLIIHEARWQSVSPEDLIHLFISGTDFSCSAYTILGKQNLRGTQSTFSNKLFHLHSPWQRCGIGILRSSKIQVPSQGGKSMLCTLRFFLEKQSCSWTRWCTPVILTLTWQREQTSKAQGQPTGCLVTGQLLFLIHAILF